MKFKEYSKERFFEKGWIKNPKIIINEEVKDMTVGKNISKKLNVIFGGWWEDVMKWAFTDPKTKSTFLASDIIEAKKKLNKIRKDYSKENKNG